MSYAKFSMETLPEDERLVQCPLDSNHRVVKHRLSRHLLKCQNSRIPVGTKKCRFNRNHVVLEADIRSHEETCPDGFLHEQRTDVSCESPEINESTFTAAKDENWDSEVDAPNGFLEVTRQAQMSNVVLTIKHGTRAERRLRREQQEQRLRALRELNER